MKASKVRIWAPELTQRIVVKQEWSKAGILNISLGIVRSTAWTSAHELGQVTSSLCTCCLLVKQKFGLDYRLPLYSSLAPLEEG